MVQRDLGGDPPSPSADDDPELDLEIERVRALRPDDRFPIADDGVPELREERRPCRRLDALLGDVVAVVEADADHLAGVLEGRQRFELAPTSTDIGAGLGRAGLLEDLVPAPFGKGQIEPAVGGGDPDDAIVRGQQPCCRPIVGEERVQPHPRLAGRISSARA